MRVWILERIADKEPLWAGYPLLDRIAVIAPTSGEARKIAAQSQGMRAREKAHGKRALEEANIAPWGNPEASTCREVTRDDAVVLAIQAPEVDVKDPRVLA